MGEGRALDFKADFVLCAFSLRPTVFSLFIVFQRMGQAAPQLDAQILRSRARINPQFPERREHVLGRKL